MDSIQKAARGFWILISNIFSGENRFFGAFSGLFWPNIGLFAPQILTNALLSFEAK